MNQSSGKALSMKSNEVYRGGATHNGLLKKIHDNSYTTGFSKLVKADPADKVGFGFGAWYNATEKNNIIYNHAPTGGTAVAVFAGILTFQYHISSGYPAKNDEILDYNRSLLAKSGFIEYKTGFLDGYSEELVEQQKFGAVSVGDNLFINNVDGSPRFSDTDVLDDYTLAGKVIELSPDTQSWVVQL